MKPRNLRYASSHIRIFLLLAFLFCLAVNDLSVARAESVAGYPAKEALRLGERMYRQGLLPSGKPMEAIIQGDIHVDGTMFTCVSCHLRSGIGSVEGTVITLPTSGHELYKAWPRASAILRARDVPVPELLRDEDFRRAYSDETLAVALRWGIDPGGKMIDEAMPRYALEDKDMEVLIYYLKNLSAHYSPGVTEKTIRFATVITDEVGDDQKNAMLAPLRAYIKDRNSQTRRQEKRAKWGPFQRLEHYTSYRRLVLDVWELSGPPHTWKDQLAEYYRKGEVFALLGGISTQEWKPIHEFCEENGIPAILPVTDYPVISDSDWYTLYFSKGLYQEGETAARYLADALGASRGKRVVQVYRNNKDGLALSRGFREMVRKLGFPLPVDLKLGEEKVINEEFMSGLAERADSGIVLLWLDTADLAHIDKIRWPGKRRGMIFLSSSLLENDFSLIPEGIRKDTYITYPYAVPEKEKKPVYVFRRWMEIRKIPLTDPRVQEKVYFLGWILSGIISQMKRYYYRDYLLERLDMMDDRGYLIGIYPNLSFGPGQRYASKGCYIVQLSSGPDPALEKVSDWVIH